MYTPLVSVNVVSYNAAQFVEETLESIKAQTYQNIELIISDDASTDQTVEICKKWLENNRQRFVYSALITSEKNTGVSGNGNRALAASHGVWRKGIGSDDLLLPDCIEKFVNFINEHPDAKFVFGKDIKFVGDASERTFQESEVQFRALCLRDSTTAKFQHRFLTHQFFGCPPAAFMNIEAIKNVGGFEERYPMNEDTSLYLRLTKAGIKLWYMDEYVVYRRLNMNSISRTKDDNAILGKNLVKYYLDGGPRYDHQNGFWRALTRFEKMLGCKVIESGNDKTSIKCRFYDFNRRWLNPFKWDMILMIIIDKVFSVFERKK